MHGVEDNLMAARTHRPDCAYVPDHEGPCLSAHEFQAKICPEPTGPLSMSVNDGINEMFASYEDWQGSLSKERARDILEAVRRDGVYEGIVATGEAHVAAEKSKS